VAAFLKHIADAQKDGFVVTTEADWPPSDVSDADGDGSGGEDENGSGSEFVGNVDAKCERALNEEIADNS
jgi:hypothetical protein